MATKNEPVRIGSMIWQAMPNGHEKMSAYYCSRDWSVKKEAVKKRSGGMCERCRLVPGENVHHLNYTRLYAEMLTDLIHLCRDCHEYTHAKTSYDPKNEWNEEWRLTLNDGYMSCPLCKDSCIHIISQIDMTKEKGIDFGFVFQCESGHEWDLVLERHSGCAWFTTRKHRDASLVK